MLIGLGSGVAMKEIGIVTFLSVAITAAAPGPDAYRPAVYVTPKSTHDFATCFTRSQERRGAAWWYVPREHGGMLSNSGAKGVASPYYLVVNDRGARREIALDHHGDDGSAREALNECI